MKSHTASTVILAIMFAGFSCLAANAQVGVVTPPKNEKTTAKKKPVKKKPVKKTTKTTKKKTKATVWTDTGLYVDLGLSVKWATCNLGATSPEKRGNFYCWGETRPKASYSWATYKYAKGSAKKLTKYCYMADYGNGGFVDNKMTLESGDDAATANLGSPWRMPTKDEAEELMDKCKWTHAKRNGVKGWKVTGPNGRYIFLPATGLRKNNALESPESGFFLTSSIVVGGHGTPDRGYYFYFVNDSHYLGSVGYRNMGFPVRPVRP